MSVIYDIHFTVAELDALLEGEEDRVTATVLRKLRRATLFKDVEGRVEALRALIDLIKFDPKRWAE